MFRLILALALLTMTGNRGGRVVLTLFALHLGANPLTVGLIAATLTLPPAIFSWPVGIIADRFGSRWPLLAGTTGVALGMLIPYFCGNMAGIYVASILLGFSFTFYN